MATIVNERDKILQAASARLVDVVLPGNIIPEGLKGITLSPSSAFFKFNATETSADPLSITFTLNRKYLTNTATWAVVTGTATLTGSGDTRSLAYSNISSDRVVIRATVTQDSVTYIAESIVTKVKDGLNGTNGSSGTNGRRGSVDLYNYSASYPPANFTTEANAVVLAQTGSSTKYAGDKVTLYNNAGYSETKYWDGISAWVTGQIINGNLLVNGTVTSQAIGTTVLYSVNIDTNGRIKAVGDGTYSDDIPSLRSAIFGHNPTSYSASLTRAGIVGYANFGTGLIGYTSGATNSFDITTALPACSGVIGYGRYGGSFRSSNQLGSAIYLEAAGGNYDAIRMYGRLNWNGYSWTNPPGDSSKFLCSDGTWAVPSGSSGVTSFNSRTGAVTLTSSDITALGTLAINITGSAGSSSISSNSSALGGYGPNSYLRITGVAASAGALVGYIIVTDGTNSYKIPGYAV